MNTTQFKFKFKKSDGNDFIRCHVGLLSDQFNGLHDLDDFSVKNQIIENGSWLITVKKVPGYDHDAGKYDQVFGCYEVTFTQRGVHE